ncbi:hypothetical protein D3C78_1074440 [compost metagenome]
MAVIAVMALAVLQVRVKEQLPGHVAFSRCPARDLADVPDLAQVAGELMPAGAGRAEWRVPVHQLLFLESGRHGGGQFVDQQSDQADTHRQMHRWKSEGQFGQEMQPFDQQGRLALAHALGQQIAEGCIAGGKLHDVAVDDVPIRFADYRVVWIEVQRRVHFLERFAQEQAGNLRGVGPCEHLIEQRLPEADFGGRRRGGCDGFCHLAFPVW